MTRSIFIITGASRGLGLAVAEQLLAPDRRLLCISRGASAALAERATQAHAELEQWQLDLADGEAAAARLSDWLQAQAPTQWANATLINNACLLPPPAPLQQSDPPVLAAALRVGLESPLLLCNAFLRVTADWGIPRKILNVSSGLGRRAMASSAAYCAVKAGMDHFTRAMALEEAQRADGAKVCSLAPGVIDTDMQTQLRESDAKLFPDQGLFKGLHARGELTSPAQAAARLIEFLNRPDFGEQPVADVRA